MERENIEASVQSLPRSKMGEIAMDHEIWEQTDGGAYFTVTRHWLTVSSDGTKYDIVALTVSGPPEERQRIVDEFTEIFGTGTQSDRDVGDKNEPDTVLWIVD